jgi:hypothetical protein
MKLQIASHDSCCASVRQSTNQTLHRYRHLQPGYLVLKLDRALPSLPVVGCYAVNFSTKGVPSFCTICYAHGSRTPRSCVALVLACTWSTGLTPNANPPMGNKTWRFTMLSRMMKYFQTCTTSYIYNGPEDILD